MSMFKQNDNLIGQANSFLEILEQTSMVAPLDKPVLVIGERGTGKELIAARLHFLSKRWQQNYVKLNCAALNDNLLESELFGHEAGAFSGASKRREGRFEYADQGTLFLDELANTSALIQEKLLRVIEYGEFERMGGSRPVKVDVRIIAATNEDLPSLAQAGDFRADLLDRLAFDVITIPPLRERKADIMILAEHFAINMARELELELFAGFSKKSRDLLLDYNWPGNIRELKNVVERAVYRTPPNVPVHDIILDPFDSKFRPSSRAKSASTNAAPTQDLMPKKPKASADIVDATDLFGGISPASDFEFPIDLKQTSQDYEISMLQQALKDSQYNQKKTAEKLSLTYHQLRGYLKKYNLLENTESM